MKLLIFAILLVLTANVQSQTTSVTTTFETTQADTATALGKPKLYKLKKQTTNSDFNYSLLNHIDDNQSSLSSVFEPVNGHYDFFQFVATFKGKSFEGSIEDFHDILIIKTDAHKNIIDAFQYTLEWAEPPLEYDLFRSTAKGLKLADNLSIAELKLKRQSSEDRGNNQQTETGYIKLKPAKPNAH